MNAIVGAAVVIHVAVKGLVCAVCAQPIQRLFMREPSVSELAISLQFHEVQITLKPGQELQDERIRLLIEKAGLSVSGIERK